MINFFFYAIRLTIAIVILILLVPQTTKQNFVLKTFHESGFFISYGEAKWFLNRLTWVLIFLFLIISSI